jgi:hypothetical protein
MKVMKVMQMTMMMTQKMKKIRRSDSGGVMPKRSKRV